MTNQKARSVSVPLECSEIYYYISIELLRAF